MRRDNISHRITVVDADDISDEEKDLCTTRYNTIVKLVRLCRHGNEQGHGGNISEFIFIGSF